MIVPTGWAGTIVGSSDASTTATFVIGSELRLASARTDTTQEQQSRCGERSSRHHEQSATPQPGSANGEADRLAGLAAFQDMCMSSVS